MQALDRTVFSMLDDWGGEESSLAVAVSGGADSMALCLLAHEWARARNRKIIALTVDHRLRAGSADEATQVGRWLAARGIKHHVLTWEHKPITSGMEEKARDARYRLLVMACHELGVSHLLLAQHQGDQAETFLLRLQSGSGADGLACMSKISERDEITLLRPLLDIPKAALVEYLKAQGQKWIEDSSNDDMRFSRNRVRSFIRHPEERSDEGPSGDALNPALLAIRSLGLRPQDDDLVNKLAHAAKAYGEMRRAMDEAMTFVAAECVELSPMGYARLQVEKFRRAPETLGIRLLSRLIRTLGGITNPPRSAELVQLYNYLHESTFTGATLGGCEFITHKNEVLVLREPGRVEGDVLLSGTVTRWDGRYVFLPPIDKTKGGNDSAPPQGGGSSSAVPISVYTRVGDGAFLGALGKSGLQHVLKHQKSLRLPPLPKKAFYALPALKSLDEILCVPHIGYTHTMLGDAPVRADFVPRQAFPGRAFVI